MPTFEELQALGATPSDAPTTAPAAKGLTFEQLTQMGAKPAEPLPGATHTTAQDFGRGALQGASLGFGDEAAAAIDTGISKIPGLRNIAQALHSSDLPPLTGDATYQQRREAYRAKNAAAQQSSPYAYAGGELTGGLALTPLVPGGGAKTLVGAIGKGIKVGSALGAVNALGSSQADLTKGDVGGAATDVLSGGMLGGLTGGALGAAGHVAGKALTGNVDKLKKWIGADLVGETKGASTATAKKMVADDIDDIADVVTKDPRLDKAVTAAQSQHPEKIANAIDAVDAKISEVTAPRAQLWQDFDQELAHMGEPPAPATRPLSTGKVPHDDKFFADAYDEFGGHAPTTVETPGHQTVGGGTVKGGGPTVEDVNAAAPAVKPGPAGVRAGDYVDHLEQSIEDLRASGKGSDRVVAAELQHHVSELKTARDWGYEPSAANPEEAQIVSNLQKQRTARMARGESTAELDKALAELTSSNKAWNPDKIVPAERLRADVTDLQKEAAQRMGGINGTPNYLRGREVASHGEDFLSGLMAQVGERNPKLVAQIAEHNRQYSALARMRDILDQRMQRAKVDEIGGLGTGQIAKVAHLASRHGLIKAGTVAAGRGLVSGIRAGQRIGANLETSATSGDKFSILVLDGLRKGLPLVSSIAAAEAAGRAAGE